MTSKANDMYAIRKHLNTRDDVYSAVTVWQQSYHNISAQEFLDCSADWNSKELLEILEDKIRMLTSARNEILDKVSSV